MKNDIPSTSRRTLVFRAAQLGALAAVAVPRGAEGHEPAPSDVARGLVDVTKAPYYADPTGDRPSRAAFEGALAAVDSAGGGIVLVPPGIYRIDRSDGPLDVPEGCGLVGLGGWQTSSFSVARQGPTFLI